MLMPLDNLPDVKLRNALSLLRFLQQIEAAGLPDWRFVCGSASFFPAADLAAAGYLDLVPDGDVGDSVIFRAHLRGKGVRQ